MDAAVNYNDDDDGIFNQTGDEDGKFGATAL